MFFSTHQLTRVRYSRRELPTNSTGDAKADFSAGGWKTLGSLA